MEIDEPIVDLCVALNKLPGIKTSESCCGHGKRNIHIWFSMDTNELGSAVMARCMSGRYYNYAKGEQRENPQWHVRIADTDSTWCEFLLEGKPMDGDAREHEPAIKLVNNIMKHIDEDFKTAKSLMEN